MFLHMHEHYLCLELQYNVCLSADIIYINNWEMFVCLLITAKVEMHSYKTQGKILTLRNCSSEGNRDFHWKGRSNNKQYSDVSNVAAIVTNCRYTMNYLLYSKIIDI